MNTLQNVKHLKDYDNTLIVDQHGQTLFFDMADLQILTNLGYTMDQFVGRNITAVYDNLTLEDSTLITVLKTGKPMEHVTQQLRAKNGFTYISKNSTYPILDTQGVVKGAIEFSKHYYEKQDIHVLKDYPQHKNYRKNNTIHTIEDVVAVSDQSIRVQEKMKKFAKTDSTLMIFGRTGTGKELVAQAIHNMSNRSLSPYLSINCSELTEEKIQKQLIEEGLLEKINGGTLFLDNLQALPLEAQYPLLRIIEQQKIYNQQTDSFVHIDLRIMAATNIPPMELLTNGVIREELFYRLHILELTIPSLKERKEDIEPLMYHFIHFFNAHMDVSITQIQEDAIKACQQYDWPGNVRELKNAMESAFHQAEGHEITIDDLPDRLQAHHSVDMHETYHLKDEVDQFERMLVKKTFEQTGGKLAESARRLGISKQLLKYKLAKYELR